MISCMGRRVRKQPIIALYFEFDNALNFYNLEAWLAYFNPLYSGTGTLTKSEDPDEKPHNATLPQGLHCV